MRKEIKVPNMGESVSEATIGQILKESGSWVKEDSEICELETDKVNQVLYAPGSGKLELSVKVDDVVKIGQVIGYIDTDVQAPKEEPPKEEPPKEEKAKKEVAPTAPQKSVQPAKIEKEEKKPAPQTQTFNARLGKEEFIAEIQKPAVEEKQAAPKQASPVQQEGLSETRTRMSKIRRVIASRLVEAQHTAAMLTTFNEIDMSAVMDLRSKYKELFEKVHSTRLGFMSFFAKVTVEALQNCPELNAYIDGEDVVYRNYFNIGIAVGTERGVIVPVLRDCDQLTFAQIEQQLASFADKARKGSISVEDLQGGGFTITNGGVYGSLLSTPILNPPQTGILGMHKIEKRPVVINDQIVIRPMMYVALSYDHRIVDGKEAVNFLVLIKNLLEDPARLLLHLE